MRRLRAPLVRLLRNRKAATAVEYGFLLAFIVLAMMIALTTFGTTASSMWNHVSTEVLNAS